MSDGKYVLDDDKHLSKFSEVNDKYRRMLEEIEEEFEKVNEE